MMNLGLQQQYQISQEVLQFLPWTEGITQKKYKLYLPDNSIIGAKMFIDHQGVFNDGAYTQFLLNRYNEIHNL